MDPQTKTQLQALLGEGALDNALQHLSTSGAGDDRLSAGHTILSNRWAIFQQKKQRGVLTQEFESVEYNRLVEDFLSLLDGGTLVSPHSKKKNRRWVYVLAGVFGAALVAVGMSWLWQPASFQQTFYLRGLDGKEDVLVESGTVNLYLDNAAMQAEVGKEGQVTFQEIPKKYKGKKKELGLKHPVYELVNPVETYRFDGQPKYLYVQVQGMLRTVRGQVKTKDGTKPVAGAAVKIYVAGGTDVELQSDSKGYFEALLPEDAYQPSYRIDAWHQRFGNDVGDYTPGSSPIELWLSM